MFGTRLAAEAGKTGPSIWMPLSQIEYAGRTTDQTHLHYFLVAVRVDGREDTLLSFTCCVAEVGTDGTHLPPHK